MGERVDLNRGLYPGRRAAALSGVPLTTLHYWAREGIVIPSGASAPRIRLWTWGDLILLRLVDWLREEKPEAKASTMHNVRETLQEMNQVGIYADELESMVAVTRGGRVVLDQGARRWLVGSRQGLLGDALPLVHPFGRGPDLLRPEAGVRIVPGKVSGEPHIEGTRLCTATLFALRSRGFAPESMLEMYPSLEGWMIAAAVGLEQRLAA